MEGPKDGFYNATPAQPSHYYYLRSSSNNGTPGSTYAAGDNYVLPKMQQPCQSPPMASPPVHAAATTPGVEGASSPPVNGPPVNGVEDAYTAMIRAATVMVVPNTGVDELKKHVREVMMTMTEVRSKSGSDLPRDDERQQIAREVSDALSAKVEMAVATAASRGTNSDASLQSLYDLEARMQKTLDAPHANERMPEAAGLREELTRIRGLISAISELKARDEAPR